MATTPASPPSGRYMTGEQVNELMRLVKGVDSIELKLTVPDTDHRSTVQALGIDALDAQIRQVFFFDTPELALNAAGLVTRARRIQGKRGDSTIKLRPVVPDMLSPKLRRNPALVVEVDAMPGGFVCSASFKGLCDVDAPRAVALGKAKISSLFSADQKAFFKEHAPKGLKLDDLTVLGPITLLKVRFTIKEFAGSLVGELWLYPDGSRILELSTKCPPAAAFATAADLRQALADRGVNLSGEQQTKTRAALEFFASTVPG